MKRIFVAVLVLIALTVWAAGPWGPTIIWQNPWSTNRPPRQVEGFNNLAITNLESGTDWWFYSIGPKTVARLIDVTNIASTFSGDAGGTNARQFGTLAGTNLANNPYVGYTNIGAFQATNASLTSWSLYPTNVISDTASNAANNIVNSASNVLRTDIGNLQGATNGLDAGKISVQGGAGNNNKLTNLNTYATLNMRGATNSGALTNAGTIYANGMLSLNQIIAAIDFALAGAYVQIQGTDISPGYDGGSDLGQETARWGTLYTSNITAIGTIYPSLLSASKFVRTGTSTQLVSSAYGDTDIANLQGGTNGLNTRVGNLEGATNGLNTRVGNLEGATNGLNSRMANVEGATNGLNAGKIDKLNGTGTNFSASLFTGTTNSPLVTRDTNSQPLGFEIVSNGVAIFGTNFQSALLISNNLGTVTLTESNSATSKLTISTANVGIGTNSTKAVFAVASPNSNTVAAQISGVFGQKSNIMQFETNGVVVAAIGTNGTVLAADGAASSPGYNFLSAPTWGMFLAAGPQLAWTVAGTDIARMTSSGLNVLSTSAGLGYGLGAASSQTDVLLNRVGSGILTMRGSTALTASVTNRLNHNALEWLESGFDGAMDWFFLRSITNNSGTVTPGVKALNISVSTNQQLYITTSNTVKVAVGMTAPALASLGGTISVNTTTIANAGTAQTNLMTYSVLGNSLTNTADRITFTATGRFAANADAKELFVIFGSETILDTTSQIVNSGSWTLKGEIIRTGNTAQSAWAEFDGAGLSLFTDASSVTLAQTNGIATLLAIATTCAGSGDVTNRTLVIQYWPAP